MSKFRALLIVTLVLSAAGLNAQGQQPQRPAPIPSIEDRTDGMRKIDGYFPLYWDERTGTLFLEIPRFDTEFLFTTGLSAGLGSNDIGLDRGQGGGGPRRAFQRVGPKVHAGAGQPVVPLEQREPARAQVGRRLVREVDAVGIHGRGRERTAACSWTPPSSSCATFTAPAARSRPGNYRVDRTRSAFYMPNTKSFPKNTEIDMTLTFVNEARRRRRRRRRPAQGPAPIGAGGGAARWRTRRRSVLGTRRQRDADRRCGDAARARLVRRAAGRRLQAAQRTIRAPATAACTFVDYSTPIGEPMQMRYIRRHRLEKKDPAAAMSEPVKPIEYWVDSGAPEDVKKALLEGASWWNQAFEAAGFRNAFKVDVLPDGADPMDIRYNMINWVHRSTRGWSSGGTVTDPRTGEIIKATVTLGSLRDRQDYMIFEGLLSPYANGNEKPDDPLRDGARAHPAARPRTKSDTRSASATTTTTARRAGSR